MLLSLKRKSGEIPNDGLTHTTIIGRQFCDGLRLQFLPQINDVLLHCMRSLLPIIFVMSPGFANSDNWPSSSGGLSVASGDSHAGSTGFPEIDLTIMGERSTVGCAASTTGKRTAGSPSTT